ncbi:hypothetical protein [uncultured Azonexus sp.]|uniref:hypothetical protein n=1 Tax=uncultured Azonexus sp. TaxID=520307 RepID=UPI002639C990|nr:hypothetical protein [uncultured Azonexus sp.]
MIADLNSVVSKYEDTLLGKKYLFVPCDNSDKLLVLLSAHNQKNRYFLLRAFLEEQNINLLFITDPKNTWYLDEDKGEVYNSILGKIFSRFDRKNIYIFGSSMAGYAAIHFSVLNNVNCLACNPQVSLDLSLDYGWHELNKNMLKVLSNGGAVQIESLLDNSVYDSVMCIVHGHAPIDVANVELILGSSTPIRKLLIYTLDTDDHAMPFGRNVAKIYEVIDLMGRFSNFELSFQDQTPQIGVLRENRKYAVFNKQSIPYRYLSQRDSSTALSWQRRHTVELPGAYFIRDVGYYNSVGALSGVLCSYDGDRFFPLLPKSGMTGLSYLSLPNSHDVLLKNNDFLLEGLWVRVPNGQKLSYFATSGFSANYLDSKNVYINWELGFLLKSRFKEGHFVTCYLDVEIDQGSVTLSLGAFGNAGYYQSNKVIEKSGRYVLTFQAVNIKIGHRDSLFARVYFLPDAIDKIVKINSMAVVHGFFPDITFFDNCP